MTPDGRSARSRYLLPLVLQAWVLGALWPDPEPGLSRWFLVVEVIVSAVLLAYVGRNVRRLWRAPAEEASWRGVVAYGLVGGVCVLLATGPLLEGTGWDTVSRGAGSAVLGLALLALAAREGRRTRPPRRDPVAAA